MATALVTGGSRGIGFGVALCLAREGHDLAIMGMRPRDAVAPALAQLEAQGVRVLYCCADVSCAEDRERALAEIESAFGALHILVNNAGVAPEVRADVLDMSEASFERVMRINLQGPFFLTQAAANWMVRQSRQDSSFRGCIVNVSSISATVASPTRGEYCMSKAGVSMATQLWAVRLAEFGIPVFEVRPGIIETDMTSVVKAKYDRLLTEGLCLQPRWGQPEDVGKAVAMLARGDLPYSTGQILMVDGGMLVQRL